MKIAQQFRAFLDANHYLPLPFIGRLEIVSTDSDNYSEEPIKRQIRFTPNNSADPDTSLKDFISEKMKIDPSITESDLAYFSNSVNELLNQGFEAEIPGIGFLNIDSNSLLKFSGKSLYYASVKKIKKRIPVIATSTFWF